MNKGGKIAMWTFIGLGVGAGLFFGTRAIIRASKLDPEDRDLYAELKKKERDGTITPPEQEILDYLEGKKRGEPEEPKEDPDYDGPTIQNNCAFPLGNGEGYPDGCKLVAQLQTALNQKHNDMQDSCANCSFSGDDTYYCNNMPDNKLVVDGMMGKNTMLAIEKYGYGNGNGICCTCYGAWKADDCTDCQISQSLWTQITSGDNVDISDAKLIEEGFTVGTTSNFSGKNKNMRYRNAKGTGCGTCNISGYYAENNLTESFGQNLPTALNCNPGCSCEKYQYNPGVGRLPLTGFKCVPKRAQQNRNRFSGFSLPQYGKKYSSPLGNFYKQQYAFKNDYPPQLPLTKSYGMGKGFGFSGQQTDRTSTITMQEFIEAVP